MRVVYSHTHTQVRARFINVVLKCGTRLSTNQLWFDNTHTREIRPKRVKLYGMSCGLDSHQEKRKTLSWKLSLPYILYETT